MKITGTFQLTSATPGERENFYVEASKATDLPLLVVKQGTAPLSEVSLSARPPRGWEVSFSPEPIDRLEAGAFSEVMATITPSSDAIAGDYRITMRAGVAETNDSIAVRATVETSAGSGGLGCHPGGAECADGGVPSLRASPRRTRGWPSGHRTYEP